MPTATLSSCPALPPLTCHISTHLGLFGKQLTCQHMLCASKPKREGGTTGTGRPGVKGRASYLCVGSVGKEDLAESCTESPG